MNIWTTPSDYDWYQPTEPLCGAHGHEQLSSRGCEPCIEEQQRDLDLDNFYTWINMLRNGGVAK